MNRSQPPAPGRMQPFEFPSFDRYTLDNGLTVRLARPANQPLVSVRLILDAGESLVDPAQGGLAVLMGDSLEGGTERRSGIELAEAVESLGTAISVVTGWDATALSVTCLAERAPEALALLSEMALRPSFPEAEVARVRDQSLARIEERRTDPGALASDASDRYIFADSVPYARPAGGTTDSMGSLSRSDIVGFHEARFRPSVANVVLVGDLDPAEARSMVEDHFGGWSGDAAPTPGFASDSRSAERRVHIVHRPGAVQSEIRVGQVGVEKRSPHLTALSVWNGFLGGTFTSRLMANLREKNGFTYGVRSEFRARRNAGPFVISTAVETAVTGAAVREIMSEVEGLIDGGATETEVAGVRDYMVGVFPLSVETGSQLASKLGTLAVYDLPDDYFATYRDRVRAVTLEDADRAGRSTVKPESFAVVVVGDADQIREQIEPLDLGPIEVHEPVDG